MDRLVLFTSRSRSTATHGALAGDKGLMLYSDYSSVVFICERDRIAEIGSLTESLIDQSPVVQCTIIWIVPTAGRYNLFHMLLVMKLDSARGS